MRRRLLRLIPIVVFSLMAAMLAVGLTMDPKLLPSALVGREAPVFDLPAVGGQGPAFSSPVLASGQPSLVNVFASWCAPCRAEHPLLMDLARQGVVIHGLNQKDANGDKFLVELGNPYATTGDDRSGRVSIEWGVYGVPETFIVSGDGRIACRHVGPLMPHDVREKILPALADLKTAGLTTLCARP
jgi:cytochrome c biogenesis protein CcmG/thiol:disulfide interchange protein DsbE